MRQSLPLASIITALLVSGCATEMEDVQSTHQAVTQGVASAVVKIDNDWGSGYCASVVVSNSSAAPISGWKVTLDPRSTTISNVWNGTLTGTVVTAVAHNGTISGGGSVNFGFCANGSGQRALVSALSYDGSSTGPLATCNDGVRNQNETGVDCGGPCSACVAAPTCTDGIRNQNETGVDCGGPCSACVAAPTCTDGIRNQNETGVDCGGPCSACSTGGSCSGLTTWVSNDYRIQIAAGQIIQYQGQRYQALTDVPYPNGSCAPNAPASWCSNWFSHVGSCDGTTPTATCSDGVRNQNETGVDCGGPCSACPVTPTCNDGVRNQNETGVDCGGPCAACAPTPTCNDGIRNQNETGVDCGGPCSACAPAPSCNDRVQNQGESGVDCGGPCAACGGSGPSCDGYATRYWDCCMAHCSWDGNVPMSMEPAAVCTANDQPLANSSAGSSCSGGNGYQCQNFVPWAVSSNVSYGYAATSSGDVCGRCYEIEFTGQGHYGSDAGSQSLQGKRMIVQAINIGYDVSGGQFDLLIPGGGVGAFNACSAQWGVSNSELGAQYGGFLSACKSQGGNHDQVKSCVRSRCDSVFGSRGLTELQDGCEWFVDWFQAADNPNLKYKEVSCPAALTGTSNMDRSSLGDIRQSCQ